MSLNLDLLDVLDVKITGRRYASNVMYRKSLLHLGLVVRGDVKAP